MTYYAMVIPKDSDRAQVLTLRARSLADAKREGVDYLKSWGKRKGRLEIFALRPGERMPTLVFSRPLDGGSS